MSEQWKRALIFIIMLLVLLILFLSTVSCMILDEVFETPQCTYGSFDAWFSTDESSWRQATVEGIILKRGEPFFIKTRMITSRPLVRVGLLFTEPGEYSSNGSTFDIIDDDLSMFEAYLYGVIEKPYSSFERIWRFQVKHDTTWVQASTPLNVFVQFDWMDDTNKWQSDEISFTILYATISSETYSIVESSLVADDHDTSNLVPTPDMFFFFLLLVLVGRYRRSQ